MVRIPCDFIQAKRLQAWHIVPPPLRIHFIKLDPRLLLVLGWPWSGAVTLSSPLCRIITVPLKLPPVALRAVIIVVITVVIVVITVVIVLVVPVPVCCPVVVPAGSFRRRKPSRVHAMHAMHLPADQQQTTQKKQ
jgi:hypothetical protein